MKNKINSSDLLKTSNPAVLSYLSLYLEKSLRIYYFHNEYTSFNYLSNTYSILINSHVNLKFNYVATIVVFNS